MHIMRWDRLWQRYLWIALAYALIFGPLHAIWISHWQLTAGFRLACLLLVPRRYWPALFVGEALGLSKFAYDCADKLGLAWALVAPFASMALVMPAVFLIQKYRPVIDANKRVVISSLLLCILAASVMNTGANLWEYSLMKGILPKNEWSASNVRYFSDLWFLGTSLGIYMVVPVALWAYTEGDLHWGNIRTRVVRSPALVQAVTVLLPCLYWVAYSIEYSHSDSVRHAGQLVMLLSPIWLTVRYGWQGASLGCMLANLAVVLSMPALHDPATLRTQELMLASSTLWLLCGARVSIARSRQS